MLQERIRQAGKGLPLWIGDFREEARLAEHAELVLVLETPDGEERSFLWPVPFWKSEDERQLILAYLAAAVFNTLSCFGGASLTLYVPASSPELLSVAEELRALFQIDSQKRSGYGKVVQISDRLCRASGKGRFQFRVRVGAPVRTVSEKTPGEAALSSRLRRLTGKAARGLYCGIDVGGTDIKAAVSLDGRLLCTKEYDWNPASFSTMEELTEPVVLLARLLRLAPCLPDRAEFASALRKDADLAGMRAFVTQAERGLTEALPRFDGIGLSFPDVVVKDRILGGETPKTKGIRENRALDYEAELQKLSRLGETLAPLCRAGVRVRITNDGNAAAFTSAVEMACQDQVLDGGVFAHSLGTDLGTGWLPPDGSFRPYVLEMYDFFLDLGSFPQRIFAPEDVRSSLSENSGLPDARKYLGQAAAFRYAYEKKPSLLEGFLSYSGDKITLSTAPVDQRKPCLEHLMQQAEQGDAEACEIFRQIGRNLGQISREIAFLLQPEVERRYLFGRFVKSPRCFRLLQEGCGEIMPSLTLCPADASLASSPLMRQLAQQSGVTVAQFGQAVGAIYLGAYQEDMDHETK